MRELPSAGLVVCPGRAEEDAGGEAWRPWPAQALERVWDDGDDNGGVYGDGQGIVEARPEVLRSHRGGQTACEESHGEILPAKDHHYSQVDPDQVREVLAELSAVRPPDLSRQYGHRPPWC